MSNGNANQEAGVAVTGHTWVKVRVKVSGVRWHGRNYSAGEEFAARWYEMQPAIGAGQVELVRILTTPQDEQPPVELVPGPAPTE